MTCHTCNRPALIRENEMLYCELHYALHLQSVQAARYVVCDALTYQRAKEAVARLKHLIADLRKIYHERKAA